MRQRVVRRRMSSKLVGDNFAYKQKKINKEFQLDVLRRDKMDSSIHTNYIRSVGATTLIFIVDEATPSVPSSCDQ